MVNWGVYFLEKIIPPHLLKINSPPLEIRYVFAERQIFLLWVLFAELINDFWGKIKVSKRINNLLFDVQFFHFFTTRTLINS